MRAGGGKTIALASVAAGGAVLVTCVLSSWETLCELWYLQRFNSRDPATRLAAGETLAEMGSLRALPFFLEILSKQGGDARAAPAGVFVKKIIDRRGPAAEPYLTAYLERGVGTSRTDVMYLTLQHFPSHAAALNALSGKIQEEDSSARELDLDFLKGVRADRVFCLRKVLEARSGDAREWAALRLEEIGAKAQAAIPALTEAARDPAVAVRLAACCALAKAGAEPDLYRDGLLEGRVLDGLAKKSALERSEAVRALGLLGPRVAGAALPQLIALAIHAEDEPLRFLAREAIGHIGLADVSVSPLSELLSCDDAALRSRAAQCLAEVRSLPEDLLPGLLQALKDADETIRAPVARALGHLRSAGHQAREALQAAKGDASYSVRHAARTALKEISDRGSP
jgi:HEAT repeat protein